MAGNEDLILRFIARKYPDWVTNAEIEQAVKIQPHQQVFQITQRLLHSQKIEGVQGRGNQANEWAFRLRVEETVATPARQARFHPLAPVRSPMTPAEFEALACRVLSRRFGKPLMKQPVAGLPKEFDLVSPDQTVVGDAKYFDMVGGERLPPAKFSVIAEHVWLLEKVQAANRFLVFGNNRQVPVVWLRRFGRLVPPGIHFYFLSDDGLLEDLRPLAD